MDEQSRQDRLAELGRLKQRVAQLEEELGFEPASFPVEVSDDLTADEGLARLISRELSDLLSVHSANGDYVYVSRNTERFFGWKRHEVLGRNAYAFFHPDDLERIAESHAGHETGAEKNTVQYRIQHADGSYTWVETRSRKYTSDGGEFIVAVTRDIQESVAVEEDLRQFTKIVSHDLRSPLVAIANLVQWLQEDVGDELSGESSRHLELIGERIDHLRELLEDLLTYARVGLRGVEPEPLRIEDMVDDISEMIGVPDAFDVRVRSTVDEFHTGRAPLRTVMANLIQNAINHHDRDEGAITVRAEGDEQQLDICVVDDGPGVPERYQERAFEIFKTLKKREDSSGTGLGLALVERIVRNAGGTVELNSPVRDGRGTSICFDWPRHWSSWEGVRG